jgi:hypothetical protein
MRISAGRWVRHALLRENIISALKTFAWLGPLTLLIWVYAERAQVVSVDNITFPIELQSADPNRFVTLVGGTDRSVIIKLSGPRSRIEQIRQAVRPQGGTPTVIVNIDQRLPAGTVDQDAVSAISDSSVFRGSGVSVTEVRPALLRVFIDPYEKRAFDVQVPESVTNLENAPAFVPATVEVRAPRSYFEETSTIRVEAEIAATGIISKPGPHDDIPIHVRSPQLAGREGVTYIPETVKANLNVRQADVPTTLPSVGINVEAPPGISQRYDVQFVDPQDPRLFNVKVIGPADKIAALTTDGAPLPSAVLILTAQDQPREGAPEPAPKPLSFHHFAEYGIRLDEPPRSVRFRLVPRATEP